MTEREIANIIYSLCYVSIQSKEGRTVPTDDIADIHVGGIEIAAKEIAERFRAVGEPTQREDR